MFNLKLYKTLIKRLLNAGLKPSTNWNKKLSKNTLFIRHDIDFSIEYAYRLALCESRLKIYSSFFFMMSTNFYNLLSSHNQKLVKEISSMGHKVSIHFDPTAYKNLKYFKYEKNVFENIFGEKVDIVSIHRPGIFLKSNNIKLSGISQTYQDVFFKKMKYISDSNCRDVFPQITKFLEEPRKFGLHLLIHPIWWMDMGSNPSKTINNWRNQNKDFITSEIINNLTVYKK
tara:strand:- start:1183 stop:1869 length:687 start_codon:yes stop_codon:yes gene_type:complete